MRGVGSRLGRVVGVRLIIYKGIFPAFLPLPSPSWPVLILTLLSSGSIRNTAS